MSGRPRSPLEIFRAFRAREHSLTRLRSRNSSLAPTIVGRNTMPPFGGARSISVGAGSLLSGIASMRGSLDAFHARRLESYMQVVAMTTIDGWKER